MKFRQYVEKEIQARKNADPIKKYVSSDNWAKEWNYFVSFMDEDTNEVVHICGYLNRPNVVSINHLFEELKTDKEFGMNSDYVDSLKVRIFQYQG